MAASVVGARTIRAMNIAVRVEGRFPSRGALISNHMGYLDIMAYAAVHRSSSSPRRR